MGGATAVHLPMPLLLLSSEYMMQVYQKLHKHWETQWYCGIVHCYGGHQNTIIKPILLL